MDLEALKQTIRAGRVEATRHAFAEMLADGITDDQLMWNSIATTGVVVEDYPTASRGPCALVLSYLPDGRPLHTVVAFPALRVARRLAAPTAVVLITVYRPDQRPSEWSADYRTRRVP